MRTYFGLENNFHKSTYWNLLNLSRELISMLADRNMRMCDAHKNNPSEGGSEDPQHLRAPQPT